jgi:hypothetical protein
MAAVANNFHALQYSSDALKNDKEFTIAALTQATNPTTVSGRLNICTSGTMINELAKLWGITTDELVDFQIKFAGISCLTMVMPK